MKKVIIIGMLLLISSISFAQLNGATFHLSTATLFKADVNQKLTLIKSGTCNHYLTIQNNLISYFLDDRTINCIINTIDVNYTKDEVRIRYFGHDDILGDLQFSIVITSQYEYKFVFIKGKQVIWHDAKLM